MYSHSNSTFPRAADFLGAVNGVNELDSVVSQNYNSCSSESPSYRNQGLSLMQRSVSSHSLSKNGVVRSVSTLFQELFDSDDGPVRRVYSTGDLQRMNLMQYSSNHRSESPLSSESSMIIESMSRACRYSPEEKQVRIQRYRTKRNQRNFNKKIKYACRKTLADSRPRIRGRFAKNEETNNQKSHNNNNNGDDNGEEEEEEDEKDWVSFFDNLTAANLAQDSPNCSSYFWTNALE